MHVDSIAEAAIDCGVPLFNASLNDIGRHGNHPDGQHNRLLQPKSIASTTSLMLKKEKGLISYSVSHINAT